MLFSIFLNSFSKRPREKKEKKKNKKEKKKLVIFIGSSISPVLESARGDVWSVALGSGAQALYNSAAERRLPPAEVA